jgi:hypothetical protein
MLTKHKARLRYVVEVQDVTDMEVGMETEEGPDGSNWETTGD